MTSSSAVKKYNLALRLAKASKPDLEKVFSLLTEAAEADHPDAAAAIGSWYANGKHVKKDAKKAVYWFRKAAEMGSHEGFFGLAVALHQGKGGLSKDLPAAFQNYLRAAIRGDQEAIREVGRCYWHGFGIDKDRELAEIWLRRADELGVAD